MPGRNYRRQDGCWNCKWEVYAWSSYCGFGGDPIPDFYHKRKLADEYFTEDENAAFKAWGSGRELDVRDICDDWEAKDA